MSRIKECFRSRFKEGVILEADFSQLETIGLALVSDDEQLKKEIKEGVDFHCVSASIIHKTPYDEVKAKVDAGDPTWKKRRQEAKAPRFALAYGAGAKGISEQSSLSVKEAQEYIDAYYARYPGVKAWQDHVAESVTRNSKYTKDGKRKGYYKSLTGRIYVFEEQPRREISNPYMKKKLDKEDKPNYSPTQMKNFPVQGISTGDIVPLVLGKVHKAMFMTGMSPDHALLINTVHDSILVDCKREKKDDVAELLKHVMEDVPMYLRVHFNIVTDLPFDVSVNIADSWAGTK